jgi:competence protein ComEA
LIDLNTASKDQLISLPDIGDVRADSIIEWRTNNLISSVNDLLAISGIGTKTINSIRGLVTQP